MPNPFHDPHMAHIVRAVASQRAQVRPALISADDLQLVRESFAWHLEMFRFHGRNATATRRSRTGDHELQKCAFVYRSHRLRADDNR